MLKMNKVRAAHAKKSGNIALWKSYVPSIAVCVVFLVIGILFAQNEIYQDDWYIEASADGFFGSENRSLFTLGPNFVILGLIWMLSLTGVRLFWLHVILVLTNFISHLALSIILTEKIGKWGGTFLSLLVGLVMAPIVSFEFQFTTTASFAIAAGCAVVFDCIDRGMSKSRYCAGFSLAVFGSCLRFDCIAYGALMFGLLCLQRCFRACKSEGRKFKAACKKWIIPFLCLVLVAGVLEICQRVGMEIENPGFRDWNSARTLIDDYELPSYEGNEEEYEKIGLSRNDYDLLLSWNYQDPAVFTEDVINNLVKMKSAADQPSSSNGFLGVIYLLKDSIRVMLGSISFWSMLVLAAPLLVFGNRTKKIAISLLLLATIIFLMYFEVIGRLIWRTEWPIWTTFGAALVALYDNETCGGLFCAKRSDKVFACCVALFALLMVKPYKAPESMYEIYKNRIARDDIYLQHLLDKANGEQRTYATYDEEAALYLSNQEEKTVYALWQDPWLQQYPIYAKDTFSFFDVGSGLNFGSLGQYFTRLSPVENAMKAKGESYSFEKLLNQDSLIAVRNDENLHLLSILATYMEEHYDAYCVFSVHKIINNVVVGRFVDASEIPASSSMETGQLELHVAPYDEDNRFIDVEIQGLDASTCDQGDVYVEFVGKDGRRCLAALMEGESRALIYGDLLPLEECEIRVVAREKGHWMTSVPMQFEAE